MNTAFLLSHLARTASVMAFAILSVLAGTAHAQQGVSADEFYRQGDALSDKVSGFMRSIFGSGAPTGQPLNQLGITPASPAYRQQQQPMVNNTTVEAPNTSTYNAPRTSAPASQSRHTISTASTSKPKKATGPAVQTPSYTAAAPTPKSRATTSKPATNTTNRAKEDPAKGGFYTSSKRQDGIIEAPPPSLITTGTTKSGNSLTVIDAPTTFDKPATSAGSSGAGALSTFTLPKSKVSDSPPSSKINDTTPAKTEARSSKSSVSASGSPSTENYPTGTAGSKPGRVISPYAPHRELDVKGLSSGSLALDPTTQKVFKVP